MLTRRRALAHALMLGAGLVAGVRRADAAGNASFSVGVRNSERAFLGDRPRFATISPRSAGGRGTALLDVVSQRPVDASLEVVNRNRVGAQLVSSTPVTLKAGHNQLAWSPQPATRPGSYILRIRPADVEPAPVLGSAVVRVLDVEATFRRRSALPGEQVSLAVRTDARWLRLTLLQCGPEGVPTNSNYEMKGVQVGEPRRIELGSKRGRVAQVALTLDVPSSGIYAARLDGPQGHLGFAPIVVRPTAPVQRVAMVVPTTTWHAYNYYDVNGDGFGDTWYSLWSQKRIDLTRPHLRAGVPERWRSYDLQFLHWLTSRGHAVDTYADEDIELFPSSERLRAAYDLLVFPGHTEYVTRRLYDLVSGFRDLGGRLILLSANNFFREVVREKQTARLIGQWRDQGRPEASLLGAQYLANDDGQHQQPYIVSGADAAPWAFTGTGLGNGSTFGRYGIEIDAVVPNVTPPNTLILAQIPDLLGPGRTAQMTYYETDAGARVFSAGVLNFGGTVMLWNETARLLDNVWERMTASPL